MTKPLNHAKELASLIRAQLREQYPSASGEVLAAAAEAKADVHAHGRNPRGWKVA